MSYLLRTPLHYVCWLKLAKRCFTHYICRRFSDFLELGYNRPEINVCCIGGGSGSDLVGLCQFMDHYNIRTTKINAVILDYYDWSNETRNLLNNIPGCAEYGLHYFNYVQFDFYTSPITNEVILQIRNADLITIVKFLSAVGVDDSYNFIQLQVLLSHMKRNARVFFMDNSGGRFGEVMGNAAQSVGLELICEVERKRISVCECEYEEMGNNRFQTLPQKTTSVSASLWKRN
uniref:Uncharacterized protein n=1 Tax=Strigamia maritima TaxID=126957 RepID=T1IR19_STRMM